jgi:hypothetical protein
MSSMGNSSKIHSGGHRGRHRFRPLRRSKPLRRPFGMATFAFKEYRNRLIDVEGSQRSHPGAK